MKIYEFNYAALIANEPIDDLTVSFHADNLEHALEQLYHHVAGEDGVIICVEKVFEEATKVNLENGLPLIAIDDGEYFLPPTLAHSKALIHIGFEQISLTASDEGSMADWVKSDDESEVIFASSYID